LISQIPNGFVRPRRRRAEQQSRLAASTKADYRKPAGRRRAVDIGFPSTLRHVRMRAAEANLRRFDCPMNIRPASSFGGSARSFP
jgi:hypothetical protein